MCRPATCSKCGKATYVGCGAHIEQVLGAVAPEDRCHCRDAGREGPDKGASQSSLGRLKARLRAMF